MLHDQDLPRFLLGEASVTTTYIQNISPYRILDDMTPKEAFIGKKLNVDHLRIFGCLVYIHIPWDKRKKSDLTCMKGIFVEYNTSSKAYRVYKKEEHRIVVSKDVIFDESIAYKKSKYTPIDSDEEEEPIFTNKKFQGKTILQNLQPITKQNQKDQVN